MSAEPTADHGPAWANSLMKTLSLMTLLHFGKASELALHSTSAMFPQEAEELFVATERNAKLRYEGYKKLSEM